MRAASLFGTLAIAHLLMLIGRPLPLSIWTLPAFLWQDLLTALLFGLLDRMMRRPAPAWILYAALVVYVALNVPISRTLSSPLTLPMMRAARGPLRDSIVYHLTFANVGAILLVLAVGAGLPLLLQRLKFELRPPIVFVAILLTAAGPLASARVATEGWHRNAYGALWPVRLGGTAGGGATPWRESPFANDAPAVSLDRYRGAAAGRNVVMIALESTAAQYLSLYGATPDPTPHLTELARSAIVAERAYTVYPESIKGLLAVLCSRYPAFQTPAEVYEKLRCPSLPQVLADAGYRTALFHSGRFMYLGMEAVVKDRGFDTLEDAGAIGGNVNSSFGVDEPAAVQRILQWIDARPAGPPFFLTYLPVAGHHPYATPERGPFSNDTEYGKYLNALHYGDASLAELRRGLQARGIDEKTLFVIFGDHGEAFGQHEGNFGHSLFIYEENVRVPYVIAAPGLFDSQLRLPQTVSLIDTAPTVLDLLDLPVPPEYQGASLLEGGNRMAFFFTDYSLGFLGLRDGCWKHIFEVNSGRSRLFDLCRDLAESKDLGDREPARVHAYRERLERWIQAQEPPH